jgi:hypothetical protein
VLSQCRVEIRLWLSGGDPARIGKVGLMLPDVSIETSDPALPPRVPPLLKDAADDLDRTALNVMQTEGILGMTCSYVSRVALLTERGAMLRAALMVRSLARWRARCE